MIKIDKKTLAEFQEAGVKKIHVFFYEAGCSGTKVDIEREFDVTDELFKCTIFEDFGIQAYVKVADKEKFDGAMITRTVTADHTGQEKTRYIFSNLKIKDRCGCGTSFSFEKKVPKIDLEKLKLLRERFGKIKNNSL